MRNTSHMTCFDTEHSTLSRANFKSFFNFNKMQRSFGCVAFSSAQGNVISCLFNTVPVEHHEYSCSLVHCLPSTPPDVQKSIGPLTFAVNSHALIFSSFLFAQFCKPDIAFIIEETFS